MKTIILTIMLAVIAPAEIQRDTELTDSIFAFQNHWDKFLRAYFGCPKTAASTAECSVNTGVIDYGEWIKARKEAKKLFKFEEEKRGEKESK